MANNTTSVLSNSLRVQYLEDYVRAAMFQRIYDNIAAPIGRDMATIQRGSSVQLDFLSDLEPVTSAISESADITPVTQRDATVSITPTSRANAIQASQQLLIQAYTDYGKAKFEAIGKNMMESIDLLAQAAALQGGNVSRAAARASLDAGTAGNLLSDSVMDDDAADLQMLKVPSFVDAGRNMWAAIMAPYAYHDLRTSGNIIAAAQYQKANIILGHELGEYGPFKLIVSPWAKVFGGAGADNASAVATTLSADANALATSITVASGSNVAAGMWLTIGTEETGDTHYATNERVRVDSDYTSGTTVNIIGEGANGGLRFDHASGAAVRNADSVAPIVYGGPASLAKIYAVDGMYGTGEYGEVVGPKLNGIVDQFESIGWKWYGGYGRISDSWLLRREVALGRDA